MMKSVLIALPGEILEKENIWKQRGYLPVAYPVSGRPGPLKDSRDGEFSSFVGYRPESCDRPRDRLLRSAFISLLREDRFAGEKWIIFGESDAVPAVPARELEKALDEALKKNPETDVFRLFLKESGKDGAEWEGMPEFMPFETGAYTRGNPSVWGMFALAVPPGSREKVAGLLSSCRLPVDRTLEVLHSRGELLIMTATKNLFSRTDRTRLVDETCLYSHRSRKMAVCLSSYKRFEDLQRQIYAMMRQTYREFHLFVAVKGMSEYMFRKALLPRFREFIEEGRLTLRLFPNKNQLSNFVDTVRDLDVSSYELFLKIDDDDFYDPLYLETINEFHALIPEHHSSFFCGDGFVKHAYEGYPCLDREYYSIFGFALNLSAKVMARLGTYEAEPALLVAASSAWLGGQGHDGFGFMEDNLMHRLMEDEGCSNIADYIREKGISPYIVVQKGTPSVLRGDYVDGHFQGLNTRVNQKPEHFEHVLELEHPHWHDVFRIIGNRGKRLSIRAEASILEFTSERLVIKWDQWGRECFVKNADGLYLLEPEKR